MLADIYLGKVTHWNDKAIAALNPGASLPATKIRPVFRSDSSGDTYALSDFLAKTSPGLEGREGRLDAGRLPDRRIGGRGTRASRRRSAAPNGAIGYLANSYVLANKLDYALIRNEAGKFPVPGPGTIAAAADAVKTIPPDNAISLTNPPALGAGRLPDLDLHLRALPDDLGQGEDAARLHPLRDRARPEARGEAAVRAVARRRWSRPTSRRSLSSADPRNHLDPSL